ncbi:MAG: outer membrane lipoprotein-sorting protein [FCB group bacterium]|nr:outer membrane lipoprotein-sorting protein [FCB group bacterium]
MEDWKYQLLGEEIVHDKLCYKIECLPDSEDIIKDTGYGKIIRWVEKKRLNTIQSLYFDKGLKEWKRLTVNQNIEIKGIDFASDMTMEDIQIQHRSRMIFSNLEVDTGIPDNFFSIRYLQRGR